ncbi:hypothetical protein QR680_018878 [Steinernema hermaphroditum]|uniref:G-protein coupled receptors family 1 profile domain-containing protein n=1 Tax=Steinernema hermaphroditum TaxID=289476 RepID=A0AA39HLL3_9BILA|nr:hypothetical protein QR680_018878 [Steinernema hermaphroditum]
MNATLNSTVAATTAAAVASGSSSVYHMRLALTVTHLLLVAIGSVNLLVILVILIRPYMRSITNVYMIGLCLADFIYLANLILVAATQINDKSWPFGSLMCTLYHGTETTGKYGSVIFVVLLAADRYCAMCKTNWCARYRNYRSAILASVVAWTVAVAAALPLYTFSEVVQLKFRGFESTHKLCIAKWPNSESARWYITFSSILIFALPLALIVYCYYHIWNKLREALKGSKRMRRASSSRAPYHRVTRLVLWVVVFHVLCWSPFWLFNLFSSILRLRISTQFDRIIVNIIHLFPYVNCALNPLLYAAHAENFRIAFRSLFSRRNGGTLLDNNARVTCSNNNTRSSYFKPSGMSQVPPSSENLLSTSPSSNGVCKGRTHSVLRFSPKYLSPATNSPCPSPTSDGTVSPKPSRRLKSALKKSCTPIDEVYMNPSHSHTSVLTAPTFGSVDLADDVFDLNATRSVNCLLGADSAHTSTKRGSMQIGWYNAHALLSSARKPDRPTIDTTGWRKYSDIEAEQRERTSSLIVPTLLVSRPGDVMV